MLNNDTIDIMTMYKHGRFQYGEIPELDSRVLKIPYKVNLFHEALNELILNAWKNATIAKIN